MDSQKLQNILAGESLHVLEADMHSRISGLAFGLKHTILMLVAQNNYDLALAELKNLKANHEKVPVLYQRTYRHVDHCIELVSAIKMKKSFPNLSKLPVSKQEEMNDRIMEHFEGLKMALKKVEAMETDIRISDSRSTLWILKAFTFSVFMVSAWALILEAKRSMGKPAEVILEDMVKVLFQLVGL